eukprot:1934117-Pyramimonas_sp.AAC.1
MMQSPAARHDRSVASEERDGDSLAGGAAVEAGAVDVHLGLAEPGLEASRSSALWASSARARQNAPTWPNLPQSSTAARPTGGTSALACAMDCSRFATAARRSA